MAVKYTKDQRAVIDARGCTLLVSAAAGSGKTAVLTRRILELIMDKEDPIDIDRLLVVTFTNAAAGEMRERIGNAINDALADDPDNAHLRAQTTLIHNAKITTIDSFCNYILRGYFGNIGLDPGFRIGDKGELKLIENEAADNIIEKELALGDKDLIYAIEALSESGDESELMDIVKKLYGSANAHPFPKEWIRQAAAGYDDLSMDSPAINYVRQDIINTLEGCVDSCSKALLICEKADGPYMYSELLETEKAGLETVKNCSSIEEFETSVKAFKFGRLSSKKDASVDPEKREAVKGIRDGIKKSIEGIIKRYFLFDAVQRAEDMKSSAVLIRKISSLTEEFFDENDRLKKDKNIISFSDAEHLCLDILLRKKEDGAGYEPTETARDFKDYFKEIMVDEYQDSNLVQEYILGSISRDDLGEPNRFMVGDVKQSIYRFRQARPELFMDKLSRFSDKGEAPERKIVLSMNFRSRKNVTDFVNNIFEKIMIPEVGGITYDADARLYPGASYMEDPSFEPEVILLAPSKIKGEDNKEREARVIAQRIKELLRSGKVTDEETGELRNVRLGDIAILLRSPSKWVDTLITVLKSYDIPAYAVSTSGYFNAPEIRVIMDMLRILVNPRQDLPLYNVMHSDIGGFTEEEIALVMAGKDKDQKRSSLFDALNGEVSDDLKEKCGNFLGFINKYRDITPYTTVRDIIKKIFDETGYININRAHPGGDTKAANLSMLLERAKMYEENGSRGIFSFIRYMEQLEKYEIDYGEAGNVDEFADVVKVMSIHKSKGLEFPVCFVSGLGSKFNKTDASGRILWDAELGFGCDYVDTIKRVRRTTIKKKAVGRKILIDSLGEELRVLYVALTRAKEKLILTGSDAKPESFAASDEADVNYNSIVAADSFLGLMKGTVPSDMIKILEDEDIELSESLDIINEGIRLESLRELYREPGEIPPAFEYTYHKKELSGLYTKTTVSELKAAKLKEEIEEADQLFDISGDWGVSKKDAYIPAFREKKENITGAKRGSAYHRIMELMDMTGLYNESRSEDYMNYISQQIEGFVDKGLIVKEEADLVPKDKLAVFGASELAERMGIAAGQGKLYKEQPFILGIGADALGKGFPAEETVLIQGIIDAWWEENDGIVILDYKTDRVSREDDLKERYKLQLEYYEMALKQITHKPVKDKILYSFRLDKAIYLE